MVCALLAACTTPPPATPTEESDEVAPEDEPESDDAEEADQNDEPVVTFSDEEATEAMYQLLNGNAAATNVNEQVLAAGDERFIPVYIEMLRAAQVGIVFSPNSLVTGQVLNDLTGQEHGPDWRSWIEWYGATDIEPPDGFTSWKGTLFARIDPNFEMFLQDDHPQQNIRVEEIVWGGVALDGIPALDNATMIPADEENYLTPGDPVFGIVINGDARAYPLRILDWHEMANDVVGGVPISLAYCTLCGAAIAFDGRASDGETYTFGSSGFLYRSNKLMYDRNTFTLWNQLTGEPVLGELAGTDVTLDFFPTVLTTWEEWQQQHPETQVLAVTTGFSRPYDLGSAYGDYFSAEETMFPVWQRSGDFDTKSQVYALRLNDVPAAYPLEIVADEQVINDDINGEGVVVVAGALPIVEVTGESRRVGEVTYSPGGEVRAYERSEQSFSPGSTPDIIVDQDGAEWQVTEEGLIGPEGEELARVSGHLAYWFGWYAFFPQTLVYEGQS